MAEVKRGGHTFKGYNKPIATPNHKSGKSHAVVARDASGNTKLIRFGTQGVKGEGKNPRTKAGKARRAAWYARHRDNIKKGGRMSGSYWSAKVKW